MADFEGQLCLESTLKNPHESPDPKIVYGAFAPWVHHGHENADFSTFSTTLKIITKRLLEYDWKSGI